MITKVTRCVCSHASQDKLHGAGQRVHNVTTKDNKQGWRCTVCSREHAKETPKKKKP